MNSKEIIRLAFTISRQEQYRNQRLGQPALVGEIIRKKWVCDEERRRNEDGKVHEDMRIHETWEPVKVKILFDRRTK